jgi:DNA replication protein DnaC
VDIDFNQIFKGIYDDCEMINGIPVCPKCHTPRAVLIKGSLFPCMCQCQTDAYRREANYQHELDEHKRFMDKVNNAFLSEAMRSETFENDDGGYGVEQMSVCRKYAEQLTRKTDYGLLLFGPSDSGKTYMSCCIANYALDHSLTVVMRSVPQLIVNRHFDDEEVLDELLYCDLLVLDDLGAERSSEYAQEFVYSIVDGRYQLKSPMIVSTNLTREELYHGRDVTTTRTYNRILEVCLPVECDTGRRRSTSERYAAMRAALGITGGDAQ